MNLRTGFHRLPVEVHDLIIECLSHDKHTLLATSSVCRAWRTGSYRHLFFSLTLRPDSVEPFAHLLENPFTQSAILPRVRQLCLNGGKPWNRTQTEALCSILIHLSEAGRIACLRMTDMRVPSMGAGVYTLLSLGFRTIRSLQICSSYFETLTQFSDFISVFTHIEQMYMRNIVCLSPSSTPPSSKIPSGLYGLHLSASIGASPHPSLTWSQGEGATPPSSEELRQLGHAFIAYQNNSKELVQVLGPSLHYLDVLTSSQCPDNTPYGIDLRHTTSLEYLNLGFPTRVLAVMPWILRILYHLEVHSLKALRITFFASRQFSLDIPFLGCLSRILREPQCQNLEVIHFFAYNSHADTEVEKIIIEHVSESLTRWHQEGKLKFTFASS